MFFAAERVRLIASTINWRLSHQRFYALVEADYKDCELNPGPETLGRPFLFNLMDKRTEIMKLAYIRTGFTVRQYFYISQQEPDEPKMFENFC